MPAAPSFRFLSDIKRFQPRALRYRGENALVLADCARLAYEKHGTIRHKLSKTWGFPKVRFFSYRGTQAFIAANKKIVIVSFRGTEPARLRDWRTDSRIRLVPGPAGKVHEGFQKSLHRIWFDRKEARGLRSALEQFLDSGQTLWFSGHSLGASLATLAAAELQIREGVFVNGLVTAGQPRTGDRGFARKFNAVLRDRCFRFVNNNDLVTRVPPRFLKYRHVGRVIYFNRLGKMRSGYTWWKNFLDRVKGAWDDIGDPGPDVIKDHNIREYVRLIRKNRHIRPSGF